MIHDVLTTDVISEWDISRCHERSKEFRSVERHSRMDLHQKIYIDKSKLSTKSLASFQSTFAKDGFKATCHWKRQKSSPHP